MNIRLSSLQTEYTKNNCATYMNKMQGVSQLQEKNGILFCENCTVASNI